MICTDLNVANVLTTQAPLMSYSAHNFPRFDGLVVANLDSKNRFAFRGGEGWLARIGPLSRYLGLFRRIPLGRWAGAIRKPLLGE